MGQFGPEPCVPPRPMKASVAADIYRLRYRGGSRETHKVQTAPCRAHRRGGRTHRRLGPHAAPAQAAPIGSTDALVGGARARHRRLLLDAARRAGRQRTDAAPPTSVRAAGAVARMVTHSGAELAAPPRRWTRTAPIPGTAWAVDPVTNQVVVSVDETVTRRRARPAQGGACAALGDAARIEQRVRRLQHPDLRRRRDLRRQYRCSLGFNVRSGSTYYFLTAGHCGNIGATWYTNSAHTTVLGTRTGTQLPRQRLRASSATRPRGTPAGTVGSQDITGGRQRRRSARRSPAAAAPPASTADG